MTVLEDIADINEKVSDWIINTSPPANDTVGRQKMKQAIALHNQLDQLLTQAQLLDLQKQNKALQLLLLKQGATLKALETAITNVSNNIAVAETVISVAAQAVALSMQIVALVS